VAIGVAMASMGFHAPSGVTPTVPDAPLSIATTAGNGQVVVAVVQAHAGDVIQVRYKLKTASAWVAANVAHKRTGTGNVTISGLTNEALYQFMAYTLSGTSESEWIGPADCAPTAGAAASYTQFLADLYAAVGASATLATACTDGLPAAHVKRGRYIHTDADSLDALLAFGPVVYCQYVPYELDTMTRDHAEGRFTAVLEVVKPFDQSVSDDLTAPSNFVERLKQELMSGANGTAATHWNTRVTGARFSIAEPKILERNAVLHTIRVAVKYAESI
jgi:hypothetical protein